MPTIIIAPGTIALNGQLTAFSLATVYAKLRTLLSALSGLDAQADNQAPYYPDDVTQGRLKFRLVSIQNLGLDEVNVKYEAAIPPAGDTYPGGLGSIVHSARGNRILTFGILIECADQQDAMTAYRYAALLRDKLALPSSRAALHAAGFGYNTMTGVRDLSFGWNNREVSAAGFELVLNAGAEAFDTPVTTIEQTEIALTTVV